MHVGLYVTENSTGQRREEAIYLTVIDPLMVGGWGDGGGERRCLGFQPVMDEY